MCDWAIEHVCNCFFRVATRNGIDGSKLCFDPGLRVRLHPTEFGPGPFVFQKVWQSLPLILRVTQRKFTGGLTNYALFAFNFIPLCDGLTSQLLRHLISDVPSISGHLLMLTIRLDAASSTPWYRMQWNRVMSYESHRGPTPKCCGTYIISRWLCSRILW